MNRRLQALLWSVVLLLSVGLVLAALLEGGGNGNGISVSASSAVEDFGNVEQFEGRGRSMARRKLDLLYVSKRRVPNGADPIHNRGEGKSARPPGRV